MTIIVKLCTISHWEFELAWFRGYMSFPATFSKITGSSLEVVTDWSLFLNGGRVDGRVGGRVCGRVESRVWHGGGSVVVGQGNFGGVVVGFHIVMFIQHMHFEDFNPSAFELTDIICHIKVLHFNSY